MPLIFGVLQPVFPPVNDIWTVPGEEDLLPRRQAVDGRAGRKHVELFTAVYRPQRDGRPVRFSLSADLGADFLDGWLNPTRRP